MLLSAPRCACTLCARSPFPSDPILIDPDGGGTVDFEEFYTWWSTPELHGAKPSKLSTLRMTVTTQHLKEQSAAAARKLNEALAANSAKRGEDDTQTINVQVSVGEFTTGSGIKVPRIPHNAHTHTHHTCIHTRHLKLDAHLPANSGRTAAVL